MLVKLTEIGHGQALFVLILHLLLNGLAHFIVLLLEPVLGLLAGRGSIAISVVLQGLLSGFLPLPAYQLLRCFRESCG